MAAEKFDEAIIALRHPEERRRIIQQQLIKTTQHFLTTLLGSTINTIGIITIFFSGRASNDPALTTLCLIIAISGVLTITLGTTILQHNDEREQ